MTSWGGQKVGGDAIYGWWSIVDQTTDEEVYRVDSCFPRDSSSWERADMGLTRKTDFDRFFVRWVDAGERYDTV